MSADHAWRTITGADEMEWNEVNEMSVEKWWYQILADRLLFVHHEAYVEGPRHELGTPAVGGERRTPLRHGAAQLKII